MKQQFFSLCYALLFLGGVSSCVVSKPYGNIGRADKNGQVKVTNAHYKKKASPTGVFVTLGATAAGAAIGANSNIVSYNSEGQVTKSTAGGAVVGGLVGLGISAFVNYVILGQGNPYVPLKTHRGWVNDYGKGYRYVPSSKVGSIYMIPKMAYRDFKVTSLQDVKDFALTFEHVPQKYFDNVAEQALKVLTRDELDDAATLLAKSSLKEELEKSYVLRSRNVKEMLAAEARYIHLPLDLEDKVLSMVKSYSDTRRFVERWPESKQKEKAMLKGLVNASESDMRKMKYLVGNTVFYMPPAKLKEISTTTQRKYYFKALYANSKPSSRKSYFDFLKKYNYVAFSGKASSVLEYYWRSLYSSYSDGNKLIASFRNFAKSNYVKELGGTTSMADRIMWKQLEKEARKVTVKTKYVKGSENAGWDDWLSRDNLTAGLVSSKKGVQYVVYGEVYNGSKFDLPIKILAKGKLYAKFKVRGTGFWTNLIASFKGDEIKYIGQRSAASYMPYLPRGKRKMYAVLLDYKNEVSKSGINILDWYKVTREVFLKDEQVSVQVFKGRASSSQLKKQRQWQYFAKNGLPSASLIDKWRDEEYEPEVWEEKYKWQLEEERQFQEEWERLNRETEAQTVSNSWTEDFDVSVRKTRNVSNSSIQIFISNDDLFFEDAEWARVKLIPTGGYEDAVEHNSTSSLSHTFYEASSVKVIVQFSVDGKIQAGEVIIAGPGEWTVEIDD